jgi:hypothetical protein
MSKGESASFAAWATGVSNSFDSPRFRASVSVARMDTLFRFGIPGEIITYNRSTTNSVSSPSTQGMPCCVKVMQKMHAWITQGTCQPTPPIRPIIPNNTRPSRLTAAAGTELAGASFPSDVFFFLGERSLQPIGLPSSTRDRWIRVAPIVQYSALLPSSLVWVFSHPQCG